MPTANPPDKSFTASCGAPGRTGRKLRRSRDLVCPVVICRLCLQNLRVLYCFPHALETHFLQTLYNVLALVQVVTIKSHRLGGLSNKHFLLTVMEAGSPRSGSQHGRVLGESPLPGHVLTWPSLVHSHREGRDLMPLLFIRSLIPP